jgi:hypothetical protein
MMQSVVQTGEILLSQAFVHSAVLIVGENAKHGCPVWQGGKCSIPVTLVWSPLAALIPLL